LTIASLLTVTLGVATAAATGAGAPATAASSATTAAVGASDIVVERAGRILVGGIPVTRGSQPAVSPDGARIAFVRGDAILVAGVDGRHARRVTPVDLARQRPASAPAWSPDGTRIAFVAGRDLYTVRVADRAVRRLTRSPKPWLGNVTPAYSPDGRTIAFGRSTDAFNSDIFLMAADGTGLRRLTRTRGTHDTLGEETMPAWLPDGRTVVFVSNRDGNFELYSIGVDGRRERRLTRTPAADEIGPRVSRDGSRLLYVRQGRVVTARVDGTRPRVLGPAGSADWLHPRAASD
jgi:Tol biopolymer transport system component